MNPLESFSQLSERMAVTPALMAAYNDGWDAVNRPSPGDLALQVTDVSRAWAIGRDDALTYHTAMACSCVREDMFRAHFKAL